MRERKDVRPTSIEGLKDFDPAQIPELSDIITADPAMGQILSWLPVYAQSDLPVLVTGEPGTGKELMADALCALSIPWRQGCQRLNCAALTESLACSELFGHVRGAFTDAHQARPGKFKQAHGGTLFLDEVGDLPLHVQPKLLRAVEQGEIEPVGSDAMVLVDVRLVAATNQDLPRRINQGLFRQDLYDRLAVLQLHLPPLRERPGDIILLAEHFAWQAARRYKRNQPPRFSLGAGRRLQHHRWPGNVRELKNLITRAVLFAADGVIWGRDLNFTPPGMERVRAFRRLPEVQEARPSRVRLEELLQEEGGNVTALSRRLQVCTKTVYRWMRSHRIDLMSIREAGVM